MTHAANPEQQAARHRELARIWLMQLASLLQGQFKVARQWIDARGAVIDMRDADGNVLRLVTHSEGRAWQAMILGQHPKCLQTGGNLVATSSAVLEDAQALVLERCIKPIR